MSTGEKYTSNYTNEEAYHKSEHDEKIPENEAGNQEDGEDAGIPLGKETIEVERGRVQELIDGGMTKAEAIESAKKEIQEKFEEQGNEKKYAYRDDKVGFAYKEETTAEKSEAVESEKAIATPKLEGETFIIDGRAVVVESVNGNGKFMVRNLTDNKIEQIDESKIKEEAEARNSNLNESYQLRFGFSDTDITKLEQNPEYQKLSFGQKRFVLDSLTTSTLEKIEDISDEKFKQKTSKKGFFGKIGDSVFKETKMAGEKKQTLEEIKRGGFDFQKDSLEAIISRASALGVPMIENEKGQLEVQYSSQISGLLENSQASVRAQRAYDQAATEFHAIPPEWESETATKSQRKMAKEAKDKFDATRQACFRLSKENTEETETKLLEESSIVDSKINLNRLMNANPGNERALIDINKYSNKGIIKNALKDLFIKEDRAKYAVAGASARAMTKYFEVINFASAGIISGIVGGFRGWKKAENIIRDDEHKLRRGAEKDSRGKYSDLVRLEKKEGETTHNSYIDKINGIVKKIEDADSKGDHESAVFYKTMLKNRIDYAMGRASKGKVTFGDHNVRLGNQAAFTSAINTGTAYASAADPDLLKKYKERMSGIIELDNEMDAKKREDQKMFVKKYAIRNAAIGASLGAAGYIAMEAWHAIHASDAIDEAISSTKGPHTTDPLSPLDPNKNAPKNPWDYNPDRSENNIKPPWRIEDSSISDDAYIKKGEGIEHALRRQIENNPGMAKDLGWDEKTPIKQFSGGAAHRMAIEDGYVDPKTGAETRVRFTGEKSSFYEIKKQPDGSFKVVEGQGDKYIDSDTHEYIYKNGVKTGVINHQSLSGPNAPATYEPEVSGPGAGESDYDQEYGLEDFDPNGDKYEKYINSNGEEVYRLKQQGVGQQVVEQEISNAANNTTSNVANSSAKATAEVKVQVGKPLNHGSGHNNGAGNRPSVSSRNTSGMRTSGNGYYGGINRPLLSGGRHLYPDRFPEYDDYGYHRTPRGTYYKTIRGIDGRDVEIDTGSRDVSAVFDGKVNRQYDKLMESTFGERNNLTGDLELDKRIKNMLANNLAEDDINSIPAEGASEDTINYLNIVHQIHETSGLEPKAGEPTGLYLREALQKMKDDGKNIRVFVKNILESDNVAPIDRTPVDDIYS